MTRNEAKFQALVVLMLYKREAAMEEIFDFVHNSRDYYDSLCDFLHISLREPISVGLNINGKPGLDEGFVTLWDTTDGSPFQQDEDIVFVIQAALSNLHYKIIKML